MHVKVRIVDVGGVEVCMLCGSVSEYHGDNGEGVVFPEPVRLSYTRRYISLAAESARVWGMW